MPHDILLEKWLDVGRDIWRNPSPDRATNAFPTFGIEHQWAAVATVFVGRTDNPMMDEEHGEAESAWTDDIALGVVVTAWGVFDELVVEDDAPDEPEHGKNDNHLTCVVVVEEDEKVPVHLYVHPGKEQSTGLSGYGSCGRLVRYYVR